MYPLQLVQRLPPGYVCQPSPFPTPTYIYVYTPIFIPQRLPAAPHPPPAESHRCFTVAEDERFMRLMQNHTDVVDIRDWEKIAVDMGGRFTPRQLMDRWYYYLRPGISRNDFTPAERRKSLSLAVNNYGNWVRIASQLGSGNERTCAQVKSIVNTILDRLKRFEIVLENKDDVACLPEEFFHKTVRPGRIDAIKEQYQGMKAAAARKREEEQRKTK